MITQKQEEAKTCKAIFLVLLIINFLARIV